MHKLSPSYLEKPVFGSRPLEPAETRPTIDPIFLSQELLFQGTISYAKHRRNNINGWHKIFWRNCNSTTWPHTCQHHAEITQSHTFAALIRLSTTTHNLLTFKISEISSNNSKKLRPLADKHLWTFLLHSRLIQVHGCRLTRSADHLKLVFTPSQSSPAILVSPDSFDS